jgi:hypothetical protein
LVARTGLLALVSSNSADLQAKPLGAKETEDEPRRTSVCC